MTGAPMDKAEQKALADIATYGWHCINVQEDAEGPGFAYTVGFNRTFGHPEVILFGLSPEVMHGLLDRIAGRIRSGHSHLAGESYWGIATEFQCHFLAVPEGRQSTYVGWARWYYKDEPFDLLQCTWPDRNGRFPWEADASQVVRNRQPILHTP